MIFIRNFKESRNSIQHTKMYLKLRSSFFITFFSLILIPILIFIFITYHNYKSTIQSNFYTFSLQNIKQTGLCVDNYLNEMDLMADRMSKDSNLFKSLNVEIGTIPSNNFKASKKVIYDSNSIAAVYGAADSKLNNAYFSTSTNTYVLYSKSNYASSIENISTDAWYRKTVNSPNKCILIGTNMRFYSNGKYEYVISVSKAVKSLKTGKIIGAFLIDYDYTSLMDILKTQISINSSGSVFYITDNNYNIMYCSELGSLTVPINYAFLTKSGSLPKQNSIVTKDGKDMHIIYFTMPQSSWKVISLIPVGKVPGSILSMGAPLIICISLCLLLILIFPFVIISMFFKPVSKLSVAISDQGKSRFSSTKSTYDNHPDPADSKGHEVNANNIDGLINKVYYSQLKQKEVQLMALQNQINPHFLYNTLESIRGAALHHGVQSIASMAKSLSSFFRYSIGEEVLVPIKAEIQHLENYIAIQNFRHDDKFELLYKVPEELYDYKILKLTLQPLVENSIKHGLEMKIGKGRIKIDVLGMESIIKIKVFDDGIGIAPERIIELNKTLEEDIPIRKDSNTASGVGVRNVNSRIKLYFGDQYGLKYLTTNIGTTVEVTFPVVE